MTEENTEADVLEVPTEAVEQPSISLTLQDITLAANIIDLAVQRGAFKAAEAGTVGNCFNKLAAMVKAVQSSQAPEGDAEQPTTEEAPEEATSEE